jgi:hypothetical protein
MGPFHLFRLPLDLRSDVLKEDNCHFSARKSAQALSALNQQERAEEPPRDARLLAAMKKEAFCRGGLPKVFMDRFGEHVTGFISGFDRLRFRATLRPLFQPGGIEIYLNSCKVLIKDFAGFASKLTERIRTQAYERFRKLERPIQYVSDSSLSKEDLVRALAKKHGITTGPVCLLACVEPCLSFQLRGDRASQQIHLVLEHSKCTHLYHYFLHPSFGQLHVRVQTWFPFSIDVCLNSREWLAHQMDEAGIAYRKRDNCFVWIQDCAKARLLIEQQLRSNWAKLLEGLLKVAHPLYRLITDRMQGLHYYWSASESEYDIDVLFDKAENLQPLFQKFLHHALTTFQSTDILRFLANRHAETTGKVHPAFKGQVTTTLKERPEGVRIRHSYNGNSLKCYDKEGSVLRPETTINHPQQFKVYRPKEGDPKGKKAWRPLRRGIADLYRRAQVSHQANSHYLEALASVTGSIPLLQQAAAVTKALFYRGRPYRGLNPLAQTDYQLLRIVSRGEFILNGMRNADLRALLFKPAKCPLQRRRNSAVVTRKLALLRAHGLLKKISHSHCYLLTTHGRQIVTALLAACHADVEQLTKMAA